MGFMRAGKLDRVVAIERRGPAQHDGRSRKPGPWGTVGKRRASVQPARGRETQEAEGRSGQQPMSFWFRYDRVTSSVTEQDSLVHEGRRYEITAPPMEVGRREGIEVIGVAGELANASEPVE
ncbi:head-tail adaptor protein [Erythrobacter sp. HA6-11]